MNNKMTYISLFSSAGVGCHGFSMEGFNCIATNEIIERRLNIQKINNKCKYDTGYIPGDITKKSTQQAIFKQINHWKKNENLKDVDVLIATPPCQGISVANHKKKNEKGRNSLIVESIKLTKEIQPKFFIYENVRSFLNTICTDIDGRDRKISEAIDLNLSGTYNILSEVINFKEHGNNSSRTRTLVIGVRKDIEHVTPFDLFPEKSKVQTLKEVIGHLPSLNKMGEIHKNDFYHYFRKYNKRMYPWIENLKEGESAFDNKDPKRRPHRIVDGKIVFNKNKNGDKYKKCYWDRVAPCIHTRNDILASQATIHPEDNRVFSIRELMLMMTIPDTFKWIEEELAYLNNLSHKEKINKLSKEDINIRQSIGEAVPTEIFRRVASRIKKYNSQKHTLSKVKEIVEKNNLDKTNNLINFIKEQSELPISLLLKIAELANAKRQHHAAYYTRQDISFALVKDLPDFKNKKSIKILEPSVGAGNFIPILFHKYAHVPQVQLDVFDIDQNALRVLKTILEHIDVPENFKINFHHDDFLLADIKSKYDVVVGNPPFGAITKNKILLKEYKKDKVNQNTNNVFSFFLEKALILGDYVGLVSPKSILSTPSFNETRELLSSFPFNTIIDHGEDAFDGVKIETIAFIVNTTKEVSKDHHVKIYSHIKSKVLVQPQKYIMEEKIPTWVLYRNSFFDKVMEKMKLDVFKVYRDRSITKKHINNQGEIRVLKSRNLNDNGEIKSIEDYDAYIDKHMVQKFSVKKFMNKENCIIVPNLTYKPRATFLPQNTIADGSLAILTPKKNISVSSEHLQYYSSDEFRKYYMISRNFGTRSLNIDSNAVYYFGVKQ